MYLIVVVSISYLLQVLDVVVFADLFMNTGFIDRVLSRVLLVVEINSIPHGTVAIHVVLLSEIIGLDLLEKCFGCEIKQLDIFGKGIICGLLR